MRARSRSRESARIRVRVPLSELPRTLLGGGAWQGRGGGVSHPGHLPRRGLVLSPPPPRRPGGFRGFRWYPALRGRAGEAPGHGRRTDTWGWMQSAHGGGSPGTWELMPVCLDGSQDTLDVSLPLGPLTFEDTFTSSTPFPNTHNSGVRRSFILRAVRSQAQVPEKRQEDGAGVGAGTRLKSAR